MLDLHQTFMIFLRRLQSYRDYHADIYPETNGLESSMVPSDWFSGLDLAVKKIDLDPKKRPKDNLITFQDKPVPERPANKKPANPANGVHGSSNGKAPLVNKEPDNVSLLKCFMSKARSVL